MEDAGWLPGTLLARLERPARSRLLGIGVRQAIKPDQVLFREGFPGTDVVLLGSAIAKITAMMADGRRALLAIRLPGDIVGETAALNDGPRTATVTSCRQAIVYRINRSEFRAFLRDNPEVMLHLTSVLAERVRWSDQRRLDYTSCTVGVCLARVLWELATTYGRRNPEGLVIGERITQDELATLCGAAEITVQKAFQALRKEGIVTTRYRRIVVRNIEGLRGAAELDPQLRPLPTMG